MLKIWIFVFAQDSESKLGIIVFFIFHEVLRQTMVVVC